MIEKPANFVRFLAKISSAVILLLTANNSVLALECRSDWLTKAESFLGEIYLEQTYKFAVGPYYSVELHRSPRLVYLKFSGCLSWNIFPRELQYQPYGDLGVPPQTPAWVAVGFEDCGLGNKFLLSVHM